MWLYNKSFHFITFIYLVDYKNTQGWLFPGPQCLGLHLERLKWLAWIWMLGDWSHLDLLFVFLVSGLGWQGDLLYSDSGPGHLCVRASHCARDPHSMVAGSWEGDFHRTWGTLMVLNDLALKVTSITRTHSVAEKWITSLLIFKGRIRLHLEEMAGSHYRRACRVGNTPVALSGKDILL